MVWKILSYSCFYDSFGLSIGKVKVYFDITNYKNKRIKKFVLFAILIFIHPCKINIPNIKKIIGKKYLLPSYKRLVIRRPVDHK